MATPPSRTVTDLFLRQSLHRLRHDYVRKIAACLRHLNREQIWTRPNEKSNSIGNLLLHLEGNLRQWIVHGIAGRNDVRYRDGEFAARSGLDGVELLRGLERAVAEASRVIAALNEDDLTRRYAIQGYWATGLAAVYHVVEHFSGHTGQIIWITKLMTGRDLEFYAL